MYPAYRRVDRHLGKHGPRQLQIGAQVPRRVIQDRGQPEPAGEVGPQHPGKHLAEVQVRTFHAQPPGSPGAVERKQHSIELNRAGFPAQLRLDGERVEIPADAQRSTPRAAQFDRVQQRPESLEAQGVEIQACEDPNGVSPGIQSYEPAGLRYRPRLIRVPQTSGKGRIAPGTVQLPNAADPAFQNHRRHQPAHRGKRDV